MIDRRQLLRELGNASLTEFVLIEREKQTASLDEASRTTRFEARTQWSVIVHVDTTAGRGSARVEVDATDDRAYDVVLSAMELARSTVGQAWVSRPPAAPAKVTLLDPELKPDLALSLAKFVSATKRPPGSTVTIAASVSRERVTVDTKAGFHATWNASAMQADALVAVGQRSLDVSREARRFAELDFDRALADAVADLARLSEASAPIAGPCSVIVASDAMLHRGGHGVWEIFAAYADAVVDRQGLSRYRLNTPIAPGAEVGEETISIWSDGSIEFGVRSAPVGEEGEAVRKFLLVEHGIATGFGLTPREAALRKRDPNGGVRNLLVTLGTWDEKPVADRRTVELRRLRDLSVDRYTGEATFEIALGVEHSAGAQRPFTGGTVRLDLVAALAKARRSANPLRRGPYYGPAAVLVVDGSLVA